MAGSVEYGFLNHVSRGRRPLSANILSMTARMCSLSHLSRSVNAISNGEEDLRNFRYCEEVEREQFLPATGPRRILHVLRRPVKVLHKKF